MTSNAHSRDINKDHKKKGRKKREEEEKNLPLLSSSFFRFFFRLFFSSSSLFFFSFLKAKKVDKRRVLWFRSDVGVSLKSTFCGSDEERTLCGTFSLEDHPLILGKEGKSRLVFYEYIFILLRRRRHTTTRIATHHQKNNHHGAAERIRSSRAHDSGRLVSSSASIAFAFFCSDARRTGAAIATDERVPKCCSLDLWTAFEVQATRPSSHRFRR